jgi:SAM-dependent methyltransferase
VSTGTGRADDVFARNVRAHDERAALYEQQHGEIYNPIEQSRLSGQLEAALAEIRSGSAEPHALDFGCGAGNLTSHLIRLNCRVTSADVSVKLLEIVQRRFGASGRCEVLLLKGDGSDVPTASFDFAGAYSVLHHVPDYVATVRLMMRALRPGGVLFIDHESSPSAWEPSAERDAWHRNGRDRLASLRDRLAVAASPSWVMYRLRRIRNPRASLEGDIHVWPDDHVEWDAVEACVREEGGRTLRITDYLLYRRHYDELEYERYRTAVADTRCLIARKEVPFLLASND